MKQLSLSVDTALQHYLWPDKAHRLYDAVRYTLAGGGKRLRPSLTLTIANDTTDKHAHNDGMLCALAVEMFHNYTLVHDDIMDKSTRRHGREAVWVKYSVPTAILAGDILASEPYSLLTHLSTPEKSLRALKAFHKYTDMVLEGQQLDMDMEGRTDCTVSDYLTMIEGKTAALIGLACTLGAISANADVTTTSYYREYGENIGMAFQIIDDMLDTYGDRETFGKPIGGDIINDKNTILRISALARCRDRITDPSLTTLTEADKIRAVTQIYDSIDGKQLCLDLARDYTSRALNALAHTGMSADGIERLTRLADSLIDRNR